ncbi:MAG: aldehyde dehydrogenase [Chloroflexi bacterium]|nr:aldehyde dehydrogenase [Chloroflexota bacterium]
MCIRDRKSAEWGTSEREAALPNQGEPPEVLTDWTFESGMPVNRTPKLYIGGKQVRPSSGYTRSILAPDGQLVGHVGEGNRSDINKAVDSARKAAAAWAAKSGHQRAQILYFIGENLSQRAGEIAQHLAKMTGRSGESARAAVELAISRLFTYGAWADKAGGVVQEVHQGGLSISLREPLGVIGITCPTEYPLLACVSLIAPAVARGNAIIVVPSDRYPLAVMDFVQVLETSDLPPGVINVVTGDRAVLSRALVEHDDVDGIWYFGDRTGLYHIDRLAAPSLKRTWGDYSPVRDWVNPEQGEGDLFLRMSTRLKSIWIAEN